MSIKNKWTLNPHLPSLVEPVRRTLTVNAVLPNLYLIPHNRRLTFENSAPDTKFVFNGLWKNDAASVNLRGTRYGETLVPNNNPDNDYIIESEWVFDASVNVNITENFDVTVGANNIFDNYPVETPAGLNFNGIFTYPTRSPFGFSGHFLYARIGAKW